MSTLNLRVRYRPVRVGWCVRLGDFDGLRRALRLTHTLWGGRFNPIIPVGNHRAGAALVDEFRIDALYAASDDPATRKFIDENPHLRWPTFPEGLSVAAYAGETATLLDITHPVYELRERYARQGEYA